MGMFSHSVLISCFSIYLNVPAVEDVVVNSFVLISSWTVSIHATEKNSSLIVARTQTERIVCKDWNQRFCSDVGNGPDIVAFTLDGACRQIEVLFSALKESVGKEKADQFLNEIAPGYVSVTSPVTSPVTRKLSTIDFCQNGDIIIGPKTISAEKISLQQRNLLWLLYTSPGFVVSFALATAIVWGDSIMDENTIKQGMWRLRNLLKNAGIDTDKDIRIYQKKMTIEHENGESETDFFICLDGVTKT